METFPELASKCRDNPPRVAIVLGSGLGDGISQRVQKIAGVPFADVPGLGASSVSGHRGRLMLGAWAGQRVLLFEGRLHFYEGHPWERVVQPVRLAAELGAGTLVLTNAAGGIADRLEPGSLMLLRDHIDAARPYWWRAPGPGGLGPPRPSPYTPRLQEKARQAAREHGIDLAEGVYACVTGPCYETPAEVRALRQWGADAAGMSTAREAVAAAELGRGCLAISCITNRATGLTDAVLDHAEVLRIAGAASERLADLVERLLPDLGYTTVS